MSIAAKINGGNPEKERHAADFYPTPPEPVEALIRHLNLPRGTHIWEPACGDGDISKVLEAHGYDVFSSDIRDTGYGEGGVDFLKAKITPDFTDWIITNPPFCLAEDFIRRARKADVPFAFLLKSQYFHAKKRLALFRECQPTEILPLTWRVDFLFREPGRHSPPHGHDMGGLGQRAWEKNRVHAPGKALTNSP